MAHQRLLDRELNVLQAKLSELGNLTVNALQTSLLSLTKADAALAKSVIDNDSKIDALELEIDHICVDLLALYHPAASDLRYVMSVVKLTPILERIADHACNIARIAIDFAAKPEEQSCSDETINMAQMAIDMVKDAIDSFQSASTKAAREIIKRDAEINRNYEKQFHELLHCMVSNIQPAGRSIRLLLMDKHVERIGDYATDICELTVFMKDAVIIKHFHANTP
jgi:phosphate transport system protein